MSRRRRNPFTMAELAQDGPALRVSDLIDLCGYSEFTIYEDIKAGRLKAEKRIASVSSPFLIDRREARRYLRSAFHVEHVPRTA